MQRDAGLLVDMTQAAKQIILFRGQMGLQGLGKIGKKNRSKTHKKRTETLKNIRKYSNFCLKPIFPLEIMPKYLV
jgi:hypothetical protein